MNKPAPRLPPVPESVVFNEIRQKLDIFRQLADYFSMYQDKEKYG
jgi:hypothetical protein